MTATAPPDVMEIPVSDDTAGPYGIATGPDGSVWFTLVHQGAVGRIDGAGAVATHQLDPSTCGPTMITTGPDGALFGNGWNCPCLSGPGRTDSELAPQCRPTRFPRDS